MEKIEEGKLAEVVNVNNSLTQKGKAVAFALRDAIGKKLFDSDGDMLLEEALNQGKEVDRRLKWWKDFIGPVVTAAHTTWKEAVARRDEIASPLDEVKQEIAIACGSYRNHREAVKREEEDRIRRQLQKQQEDEQIAKAAAMEKSGAVVEAEEVLNQEVVTPAVVLPSAPKVENTGFRKNWKFRVLDENKIPREYLCVDEVKIGKMVRAAEGKLAIPGVEVYAEDKATFTNR